MTNISKYIHFTGSKQVPIKGYDDKRQITAYYQLRNQVSFYRLKFCTKINATLVMISRQKGTFTTVKVIGVHPKLCFVIHSESHWSTSKTMIRYVEKGIVPYVNQVKDECDLPLKQKAICIFDVLKRIRTKPF